MLPHYQWKVEVQICDKLQTRLVDLLWCPSASQSIAFVDPGQINRGYYSLLLIIITITINIIIIITATCSCHSSCWPWCQAICSSFNKTGIRSF